MSKVKVHFVGNVCRDAEHRVTKNGKDVLTFTVAVNEHGRNTEYVRCNIYGALGNSIGRYVVSGKLVEVCGTASTSAYMGGDGKPHSSLNVYVEDIFLLSGGRRVEDDERQIDLAQGESAVGDAEEVFAGGKTMEEIKASWDSLTMDDIPF